ncbi:lycopene cyclase family protein [Zhouia sp. PK063]|uniref:lycopene cyclase family protein n=1 Tax=Zhouia sp. PK063 TaxID=3373602 RepID=UPI0037B0FB86
MKHFDYIITGGGAAGLLLAYNLAKDSFFKNKTILIIEKEDKNSNDRTWCFWEKGIGEFDHLLTKTWDTAVFKSKNFKKSLALQPYQYKMLRSANLYIFIKEELSKHAHISFLKDDVITIKNGKNKTIITTQAHTFTATFCFNSIIFKDVAKQLKSFPGLQQHFKGWFIKTTETTFNENEVIFMDFDISQHHNTRFMYVLPIAKHEALIEYTLFSKKVLPSEEYEQAILNYLQEKNITNFSIEETETGNIPMSMFNFSKYNSANVIQIGTAGGWTKPSSGYTFKNILRNTDELVKSLKKGKPTPIIQQKKYRFYDSMLLKVLLANNGLGSKIFTDLFKKNKPEMIFSFLDETSSFAEDLKIISSLPKLPFLKALFKR